MTTQNEQHILSRDEFFADDLREQLVPHKKGFIRLREMTDAAREQVTRQATIGDTIDRERLMKYMILASVVEPAIGPGDYERLQKKSATLVAALYMEVEQLNAMTQGAIEEAVESLKSQ